MGWVADAPGFLEKTSANHVKLTSLLWLGRAASGFASRSRSMETPGSAIRRIIVGSGIGEPWGGDLTKWLPNGVR